jgi:deoxyadenosine/deoxycytidine kinase
MFIAIEGNAGTGKTTLANALSAALGMRQVLEPGDDELRRLYSDIARSPLRVQIHCLAHRLKSQRLINVSRSCGNGVVSDFLLVKDRVYGEIWLPPNDLSAYLKMFDTVSDMAETPDLLIYLEAPIDFLVQRLRKRNRSFETFVDYTFLSRLGALITEHVLALKVRNTVVLNSTAFDIVAKPNELAEIIKTLRLHL